MSKYIVGDKVFYGKSGACTVAAVGHLDFGKEDQLYYTLNPIMDERSVVYVKTEIGDDEFREVADSERIKKLMDEISDIAPSTYNIEKNFCEDLLKDGDQIKIAALIKQLRILRKDTSRNRKGLNISEERILRSAEKILYSEVACALSIGMEEAREQANILLEA